MEIPKEIIEIMSTINNGMIWFYIGLFVICMYLLVGLLTWNLIKPLKYLGISTLAVGILFIVIRFSANALVSLIGQDIVIIKMLLPSVLKPILFNGILCILVGIAMIILCFLINKKKDKKEQKTNNIK